jgi:hypothetical protein
MIETLIPKQIDTSPASLVAVEAECREGDIGQTRDLALKADASSEEVSREIIIVADSASLIVLAEAGDLAVLLGPQIPIEIPDVVCREATRIPAASRLVTWTNENREMVRIVPTETGIDYLRRLEENRPTHGMGEQAVFETLDIFYDFHPKGRALLLFEDANLKGRRAFLDDYTKIIMLGKLRYLAAKAPARAEFKRPRLDFVSSAAAAVAKLRASGFSVDVDRDGFPIIMRRVGRFDGPQGHVWLDVSDTVRVVGDASDTNDALYLDVIEVLDGPQARARAEDVSDGDDDGRMSAWLEATDG